MEYLGQCVEIMEHDPGWISIWWHEGGMIQLGYFITPTEAWQAVVDLIQRDLAVRSLLCVLDEWRNVTYIDDLEYALGVNALVSFVLA
ncbi:hypothetical protein [Myxacorys almedinensis]|uniref:Uncharacterized protein n=1 Tax=Myxacorys almedinensis A TaxID=2690445 RepID=A0A8J7Z2H6_9CYAN|nr:hypothetical protein [Myxacorys almedinensis]NDJ19167.1 hypothetical protein [Myxacorys almedinensis A]